MSSVDVVIPCYRYGKFLRQCVEAALNQEGADVRVRIVDDASPDDTPEVAQALMRQDSRVSYVRHETNQGHIPSYNEGCAWVEAEYTILISADDYLLPGAFRRATELMQRHPEVAFVFGDAEILHADGRVTDHRVHIAKFGDRFPRVMSGPEFLRISAALNLVPTPTVVLRSALLREAGAYRPELPHSGDMELWLRLAAYGSVGVVRECQAAYRRHAGNMSIQYYSSGFLPDLVQRELALKLFFEQCSVRLPEAETLQREMYHSLGLMGIRFANKAFDNGDLEIASALADFGLRVSPRTRLSKSWAKYSAKRMLGRGAWRAITATRASADPKA